MPFPDRTLDPSTVERSIQAAVPAWEVRDATLTESGHAAVYRCRVAGGDGTRVVYLKATPDGEDLGVDLEARLLVLLAARTDLPVPHLVGAVDEAADLPTPLHVTEAVRGRTIPRSELGTLDRETVGRVARTLGAGLADLHALDGPDGFGYLEAAGSTLTGERPPADPEAVRVTDPSDDWQATVAQWADGTVERLADTRFADVADEVRPVVDAGIGRLTGEFRPALCHIDGAIENVAIVDGKPTALLDWAFSIAATPAWDLVCVERGLAGGHWAFVPGSPDLHDLVHEALFEGYRPDAPAGVLAEYEEHGDLYHLLALLRSMTFHDDWFALEGVDDERVDAAAASMREALAEFH